MPRHAVPSVLVLDLFRPRMLVPSRLQLPLRLGAPLVVANSLATALTVWALRPASNLPVAVVVGLQEAAAGLATITLYGRAARVVAGQAGAGAGAAAGNSRVKAE